MTKDAQVYRNDLDLNNEAKMKKLIQADKLIIAKFKDGKYTTDDGYLNQIH